MFAPVITVVYKIFTNFRYSVVPTEIARASLQSLCICLFSLTGGFYVVITYIVLLVRPKNKQTNKQKQKIKTKQKKKNPVLFISGALGAVISPVFSDKLFSNPSGQIDADEEAGSEKCSDTNAELQVCSSL